MTDNRIDTISGHLYAIADVVFSLVDILEPHQALQVLDTLKISRGTHRIDSDGSEAQLQATDVALDAFIRQLEQITASRSSGPGTV